MKLVVGRRILRGEADCSLAQVDKGLANSLPERMTVFLFHFRGSRLSSLLVTQLVDPDDLMTILSIIPFYYLLLIPSTIIIALTLYGISWIGFQLFIHN